MEETFTGHDIVKLYGHSRTSQEVFDDANERLFESSFKAQFISGIIQPAMMLLATW